MKEAIDALKQYIENLFMVESDKVFNFFVA